MQLYPIAEEELPPDTKLIKIVAKLSKEIKVAAAKRMSASDPNIFDGQSVKTKAFKDQYVPDGTNYFVKVLIGCRYFHARIFQGFGTPPKLIRIYGPHHRSSPIGIF